MATNSNEDSVLSQYVPGFRANLNLAPQQLKSKLFDAVVGNMEYDAAGTQFNADDVLATDPEDVQTRVADTPDKFLGFTRRVGFFGEYHDAAWLDNIDKAKTLEDPTNSTMQALMAGRGRKIDSTILAAAIGTAYERQDGPEAAPTAVAFPTTQIVGSSDVQLAQQGEVVPDDGSDYGLSIGKLIYAGLLLDDSELEGDERYFAASAMQKADLLRTTPATSTYYTEVQALVSGKLDTFLGFKFIWLPRSRVPLKSGSTTIRRCVAWEKPAIVYNARTVTTARISIRNDKSDTPQAFYKASHGAVRRYDKAVVAVDCLEKIAKV